MEKGAKDLNKKLIEKEMNGSYSSEEVLRTSIVRKNANYNYTDTHTNLYRIS